jgi:16S rRNA (adenine(1408)-N(1))-methyltransferase
VTIDVGTGDGRAVLDAAAREPATLVLGLDASAVTMAEASRRAAGPARKGGRPNAGFVVAAAEDPPVPLRGVAELVTVRFPWGSLLRGVVGLNETVARGVAGLVAPGGTLELVLAPADRDRLAGVPTSPAEVVAAATRTFCALGFDVAASGIATDLEIQASGSTWARRLLATATDRRVMLVRLTNAGDRRAAGGREDERNGRTQAA